MTDQERWSEVNQLLSEISVALYGFDIYMAMNYAERTAFASSEEAAKIRAIHQEKWRREAAVRRAKMTSEERERHDKEMRLLNLELEKVNREIEAFDRRYKNRSERVRESKHASSKATRQGVINDE
ncbi:hypothetical protein RAC89_19175 [Paenibacillus sp. GD4]|uniref:hypothetical protein n=1 Tax=Paenibacillus sp. GD4 TaxID=3068890 RepID=UPI00279662BF|nr:hypothetical protein [Paenibacillus sp. GD4]MDQ1912519.1 hypothetical protein [Paenibacillus sp. GD4]